MGLILLSISGRRRLHSLREPEDNLSQRCEMRGGINKGNRDSLNRDHNAYLLSQSLIGITMLSCYHDT